MNSILRVAMLIACCGLLAACVIAPPPPSYIGSEDCGALRAQMQFEIDRQAQRAVFAEGMEAAYNRARMEQNMIGLERRYRDSRCDLVEATGTAR